MKLLKNKKYILKNIFVVVCMWFEFIKNKIILLKNKQYIFIQSILFYISFFWKIYILYCCFNDKQLFNLLLDEYYTCFCTCVVISLFFKPEFIKILLIPFYPIYLFIKNTEDELI